MSSNSYPSDWNSRRKEVYRRDGYECQNCGAIGGRKGNVELHAHHIVPKSKGGTHETTNLVTVCKDCHDAVHGNKEAPTKATRSAENVQIVESIQDLDKFHNKFIDIFEEATGLASIHEDNPLSDYKVVEDSDDIVEMYKNVRKETIKLKNVRWEMNYSKFENANNIREGEAKQIFEQYWDCIQKSLGNLSQISANAQQYLELLESIECKECDNVEKIGDDFCSSCGNQLQNPLKCGGCGENTENISQDFCKSCGTEIEGFSKSKVENINSVKNNLKESKEKAANRGEELGTIINDISNMAGS